MLITSDNIEEIKGRAMKLWKFCGLSEEDLDFDLDEYIIEGDNTINFAFPGDEDTVLVSVEDLVKITDNMDSYQEKGESTVRCGNLSQTNIEIENNWYYDGEIFNELYETETFIASIIEDPILIGIRNLKHDCYNYDYWSPCKMYHAIEFRYKEGCKKLPYEEELDEIYRFLFTLNAKHNYLITIQELPEVVQIEEKEINDDIDFENYDFEKEHEKIINSTKDLPQASPMLKMYLDALSINDKNLRFLLFYKIIEFISPIIANSLIYKKLEDRLNIGIFSKKDEEYYDSIINLVHRYYKSMSDSQLASSVLVECCDIELTWLNLPESVRKIVCKESGIQGKKKIEEMSDEEITKLKFSLGNCLYSTRNSIVHAKSNYTKTDTECPEVDMNILNDFMKTLTYTIIMRYNNRMIK